MYMTPWVSCLLKSQIELYQFSFSPPNYSPLNPSYVPHSQVDSLFITYHNTHTYIYVHISTNIFIFVHTQETTFWVSLLVAVQLRLWGWPLLFGQPLRAYCGKTPSWIIRCTCIKNYLICDLPFFYKDSFTDHIFQTYSLMVVIFYHTCQFVK